MPSRSSLPYLYLGYWIANSRKMAYKSRFRPIEGLIDGHWQTLEHSPTREPMTLTPARRCSASPSSSPSPTPRAGALPYTCR